MRAAAIKALASFPQAEDLSLLRALALAPDDNVAAEGVRALASVGEELARHRCLVRREP